MDFQGKFTCDTSIAAWTSPFAMYVSSTSSSHESSRKNFGSLGSISLICTYLELELNIYILPQIPNDPQDMKIQAFQNTHFCRLNQYAL